MKKRYKIRWTELHEIACSTYLDLDPEDANKIENNLAYAWDFPGYSQDAQAEEYLETLDGSYAVSSVEASP